MQAQTLLLLHQELTELEAEIDELENEMEFVRNGENTGYYHVHVPDSYYIDLNMHRNAIASLQSFLHSYNPESGV